MNLIHFFIFYIIIIIYLLHFRFWGTCEEHARLLHRYTYGSVICCLPPHHLYLAFLPMLSLPNSPPPAVPPLLPPYRPQCVMLPSLCPCVLIVQHLPMSENMRCLIFCSCVSFAENDGFQVHPCPYKGHEVIFDGCIVFHGVYVPQFPCPVYHRWAFGLVLALCYCKQCCSEHSCACVLIVE